MKKSAITYAETLVCLLIMGMAAMSAFNLTAAYQKSTYETQARRAELLENMNIAERMRAEVHTLPQLYTVLGENENISAYAVGIGDIQRAADGGYEITDSGRDELPEILRSESPRIVRLKIGDEKNTTINTVVILT